MVMRLFEFLFVVLACFKVNKSQYVNIWGPYRGDDITNQNGWIRINNMAVSGNGKPGLKGEALIIHKTDARGYRSLTVTITPDNSKYAPIEDRDRCGIFYYLVNYKTRNYIAQLSYDDIQSIEFEATTYYFPNDTDDIYPVYIGFDNNGNNGYMDRCYFDNITLEGIVLTDNPSESRSIPPSKTPTNIPTTTFNPSTLPSISPTKSESPSESPTIPPSKTPTNNATTTFNPSISRSLSPSVSPSISPTLSPTNSSIYPSKSFVSNGPMGTTLSKTYFFYTLIASISCCILVLFVVFLVIMCRKKRLSFSKESESVAMNNEYSGENMHNGRVLSISHTTSNGLISMDASDPITDRNLNNINADNGISTITKGSIGEQYKQEMMQKISYFVDAKPAMPTTDDDIMGENTGMDTQGNNYNKNHTNYNNNSKDYNNNNNNNNKINDFIDDEDGNIIDNDNSYETKGLKSEEVVQIVNMIKINESDNIQQEIQIKKLAFDDCDFGNSLSNVGSLNLVLENDVIAQMHDDLHNTPM